MPRSLLSSSSGNRKDIGWLTASDTVSTRSFFEPRQGLHFARNKGIAEARGDTVVFGDDDITADKEWLERLTVISVKR